MDTWLLKKTGLTIMKKLQTQVIVFEELEPTQTAKPSDVIKALARRMQ